jgi:hypothetical protein
MNVLIKSVLSIILITFTITSFTNILAGESDGSNTLESDSNHFQLNVYIKEMQSNNSNVLYASHNETLEDCLKVINNTLPFQSNYKQCEIKIKEVYIEFANL